MNINFNSYSSVNSSLYTSSSKNNYGNAQYKAVEDKELSDIISEEAIMSPEQKMLYELLGGREAHLRNRMKLYDSNGNLLNGYGVAGMCVNGKDPSEYHQIVNISEEYRQKMFDQTKKEYIQENGVGNGNTTKRSAIYTEFQKSLKIDDRLKGSYTLEQYEKAYTRAFYNAVKASDSEWEIGKPFNANILNGITREDVEKEIVQKGNELTLNSIDYLA